MRVEPARGGAWPVEEMTGVLAQRLDVERPEAHGLVVRLREVLDWRLEITDNELEKDERAFLWSLLLEGVVTTETRTRPHPEHGRPWRYHHWMLVPPKQVIASSHQEDAPSKAPPEIGVYDQLPSGAWRRDLTTTA